MGLSIYDVTASGEGGNNFVILRPYYLKLVTRWVGVGWPKITKIE